MKEDTDRSRNWIIIVSTLCIVAVGVLPLAQTLWLAHLRGRVDAHLDAWRARGVPATLEELDAWYDREPPVPNAADVYDAAFAQYVGKTSLARSSNLDEVCAHVTSNSTTLALLHEAANIEEYYRPLDLDRADWLLPHLQDFVRAGRLLVASGNCAVRDGQYDTVGDNLATLMDMSRDLASEPVFISQLVGRGLTGQVIPIVRNALEEGVPTEKDLRAWTRILTPHADPVSMESSMISQFAWVNSLFLDDPSVLLPDPMPDTKVANIAVPMDMGIYELSGLLLLDHLVYLKTMTAMYGALLGPYTEWQDSFHTIAEHVENLPTLRILTRSRLSTLDHIHMISLNASARIRSTMAALAVERYRLDHGSWPDSLDLLVPDYLESMPEDPFTGTNLIYRIEKSGYVVYSTGRKGVDDGGNDLDPRLPIEWDIVFRVDKGGR